MPKISKNASVILSLVCCGIGFLGLIAMAILLPASLPKAHGAVYGESLPPLLVALAYVYLVPVAVADGFLVKLLLLLRRSTTGLLSPDI